MRQPPCDTRIRELYDLIHNARLDLITAECRNDLKGARRVARGLAQALTRKADADVNAD